MSIFDQIASAVASDFVTGSTINQQYQAPQPKESKQEPVAFLTNRRQRLNVEFNATGFTLMPKSVDWKIPLYTTPPQRKPLTDEQIDELSRTMVKGSKSVNWLCRAIEAAHGIKE